jgi:hypothetical protein
MKILREEISRIKELMDLDDVEFSGDTDSTEELGEQEDAAAASTTSTSSGGGTPSVPVWASGRNFGKTYMNDPKYKWESGLTRGKANSLY